MTPSLKTICAATAFVAVNVATVATSSAMPIASQPESGASALVQDVGYWCGPGWHVNPWGRCVPNHWGYGWGWGYGRPWGWHQWHHWHRW
jgi:hypothetical protein